MLRWSWSASTLQKHIRLTLNHDALEPSIYHNPFFSYNPLIGSSSALLFFTRKHLQYNRLAAKGVPDEIRLEDGGIDAKAQEQRTGHATASQS